MRTKEEILEEERACKRNAVMRDFSGDRTLEVLLDIRDALIKEKDWWIGHKVNCPRTTGQKEISDTCGCNECK